MTATVVSFAVGYALGYLSDAWQSRTRHNREVDVLMARHERLGALTFRNGVAVGAEMAHEQRDKHQADLERIETIGDAAARQSPPDLRGTS